MRYYVAWRASHPGLWLGTALVAEMASYATASDGSASLMPWLILDLWLAHRIRKGGSTALAMCRFLQAFGVVLFGSALVLSLWDESVGTRAGPGTVALWAISLWCLFAPALSLHVAVTRHQPAQAIPDTRPDLVGG